MKDQSIKVARKKRLRILGEDEINTVYGRPRFSHRDRINHFSLNEPEKELLPR